MAVSAPHALMVRDQECGRYSAPSWHVIQAEATAERLAAASIRDAGFQCFLPLVRIAHPATDKRPRRTDLIPAFRGYVFALWSPGDVWQRIKRARGVASILHHLGDPERPAAVSRRFMEGLLAVASIQGVLEDERSDPDILPAIQAGADVRICGGALGGRHAICTWSNEDRVRLMLAETGHGVLMRRDHVVAL